ncbi:MAG: glycoside hydrolase family 3 C-terminal domain-containing protein [Saprospiraceae bacterium]|nr:glycoside hydrolase family 3 C-terminal domain-containing protein [Saprospiraceae bacterium]
MQPKITFFRLLGLGGIIFLSHFLKFDQLFRQHFTAAIQPVGLVDSLLSIMTLEEKVGQMTLFTSDLELTGPTLRANYKEDIQNGRCGAIFNAHTAAYTRELQKIAVNETRLGIPLLFGYDVIHGYKTIFPIPLGESASWDLEAIEKSARVAADESTAAGLHWTFAPMVDVSRDPRWGRVAEGAGEDHYLGAKIAAARVKGFQGDNLKDLNSMLACVKHFAAYGAPQAGRDYHSVDMSEMTLREIYLPPYKAAIDAGAKSVMTSFNDVFGVPATGNTFLLKQILRDEWGFDGFVVTDYTSINEMVPHGVAANEADAGLMAAKAGVDMDMQGAVYYKYLLQQVRSGQISMRLIDESVKRILKIKEDLGLFEDPFRYCNAEREKQTILSPANRAAARDVAKKSIVLLKNQGNILPIDVNKGQKIALIGPLAETQKELLGSWSASGVDTNCVSLKSGLLAQIKNPSLLQVVKGCNINGNDKNGFNAALAAAKKADIVIMALGEEGLMSGEAASRADIRLPGVQEDLLKAVSALGKPIIVVLMNGRPLILDQVDLNAQAILETWFLGTEGGNAIADVLFGKYNPSGKLPMTFPKNMGQIPIHYNVKSTGRPFDAINKYTSKYLDSPNEPLYPFGFGLSYTQFEYSSITLNDKIMTKNSPVEFSVVVKNTGALAGEEVVQLYIRDVVASVTRPVRELKRFEKINLKAGEQKTIKFTLSVNDLTFYNPQNLPVWEPGAFEVFIGGNSLATLKTQFSLVQ